MQLIPPPLPPPMSKHSGAIKHSSTTINKTILMWGRGWEAKKENRKSGLSEQPT